MSFKLMYADELKGFAKSKVMIILWIGLPLLSVLFRYFQPQTEGMPLLLFIAVLIASIGGTLSAVLLSTTVTSERNRHVYDLFLIRPVKRSELMLAKYFAALTSLLIAAVLSVLLGTVVAAVKGRLGPDLLSGSAESLVISFAGMAIACSVGLLFGTLFNSVAVSAILSVYLGNQLSSIIILPAVLIQGLNRTVFSLIVGIAVPVLILFITIKVFEKKTL